MRSFPNPFDSSGARVGGVLRLLSALTLALPGAGVVAPAALADVTVAFTGDQGVRPASRAVLQMIRQQGVELLILQGDLGYGDSPAAWGRMMDEELGTDFPVLSVAGNHDIDDWPAFRSWLWRRQQQVDGLSCSGDIGTRASCTFGGLTVVQSAPGVRNVSRYGPDHDYAGYVEGAFADADDGWRVCSFHKNQRDMQTGRKGDETGWAIYEACRRAGAMVVTGHEHAYARTHLLSDFEHRRIADDDDDLTLSPGRSIAVVAGLGGQVARPQYRDGDWWASVFTADQGASSGALICRFGDAVADCAFHDVSGAVPDRFTLRRQPVGGSTAQAAPNKTLSDPSRREAQEPAPALPLVHARTDKREWRWIDRNAEGAVGSIWISEACAARLGGASVSGDWQQLIALAPGHDTVASPCVVRPSRPGIDAGFVFSRTDKREHRWIAPSASGEVGSVWISAACVERLGVASRTGDWWDLMALAPAFDQIQSPCL